MTSPFFYVCSGQEYSPYLFETLWMANKICIKIRRCVFQIVSDYWFNYFLQFSLGFSKSSIPKNIMSCLTLTK